MGLTEIHVVERNSIAIYSTFGQQIEYIAWSSTLLVVCKALSVFSRHYLTDAALTVTTLHGVPPSLTVLPVHGSHYS